MQKIFMKFMILLFVFLNVRAVEEKQYIHSFLHVEKCMCEAAELINQELKEQIAGLQKQVNEGKVARSEAGDIRRRLHRKSEKEAINAIKKMINFNKETDIIALDIDEDNHVVAIVVRSKQEEIDEIAQKLESARDFCNKKRA